MLDPWRWCDADDESVSDFLAATIQGFIECGGWINPDARLIARRGALHIECEAEEGAPLIRVPRTAMLPVTRVQWHPGRDELSIDDFGPWPKTADLSLLPLLLTQIGLHNSCDKLPRLTRTHPSACVDLPDDVVEAIRVLRPSFRSRPMSAAEVFWSTRTFRLPAFDAVAEPVALPVLDLLDHHPRGSVGQWHDDSFTVTVARPTGTPECFVTYGWERDALDMALVYGFADTTAPWAHCGPMVVQAPEVGTVRVLDQGRTATGELLPLRAQRSGDVWSLNRFTFESMNAAADLSVATGQSLQWCAAAVAAIATGYLAVLAQLRSQLVSAPPSPATDVLLIAIEHLRSVVEPLAE